MTLFGDFMATVPPEEQSLVKDLAVREGVSTRSFVESLLGWALARYQAKETHIVAFADTADYHLPAPCVPERSKVLNVAKSDDRSVEVFQDFARAV